MKVVFKYMAQVRQAAGAASETVELGDGTDLAAALAEAAGRHGQGFRSIVLDADGRVRPSLVILVNDEPAPRGEPQPLADGDEVTILSPIAGG